MAERDISTVLDLVDADRLTGQPEASASMLADAAAGRSAVDAGWWEELSAPRIDVLDAGKGNVVGVVSHATRDRDGAGLILWLHGREQRDAVDALIAHALSELRRCPVVDAFDFATPLGIGLEALPVRHRPATATALRDRGFVGRDLWRYLHRPLPAPPLPRASAVSVEPAGQGKRILTIREGERVLAEATVGDPMAGIGVLWWISVEEAARGRDVGRALLTGLGAREVILYVDDDEPHGDRDRTAANRLYESAGFVEIDRLHSFQLPRRPT